MDGDLVLALLFALRRPRDKILEADGRLAAGSTMVPRLWLVLGPMLGVLSFPSSVFCLGAVVRMSQTNFRYCRGRPWRVSIVIGYIHLVPCYTLASRVYYMCIP